MMTPEEIEAILKSNAKAIASNSNAIVETRREINSLYQIAAKKSALLSTKRVKTLVIN
jgi:hypothetical protein